MPDNYTFLGRDLDSPLYNAEGSLNGPIREEVLKHVEILARSGIGMISFGSITVPAQQGNEAQFGGPTYYHDAATGFTYNSMGLPNVGLEEAMAMMPEVLQIANAYGKPVMLSVSPTLSAPEYGDPFQQTQRLVEQGLNTGIHALVINTSCPNIVTASGARKPLIGYDLEAMQKLEFGLQTVIGDDRRVGLKLPPYITPEQRLLVPDIAELIKASDTFSFVVASNTIPGQVPVDAAGNNILSVPGGAGGMSGAGAKAIGRAQLEMWVEQLGGNKDIISTLGVTDGSELAFRIDSGANVAGGVTFLWESENWGQAVTQMLNSYVQHEA